MDGLPNEPPVAHAERPNARAVVSGSVGDAPWCLNTAEYRSMFGVDWWQRMSPTQQYEFAHMHREAQVMENEMKEKTNEIKEKTRALEVVIGEFEQLQIDMRNYVQMNMIPSDVAPQPGRPLAWLGGNVLESEATGAVSFRRRRLALMAEHPAEIVLSGSTSASSTRAVSTSPDAAARGPTRSRSLEHSEKVPEPCETTVLPAHAGNAQVRETLSAPATRFSRTAVPPPPNPPMKFEVEVQPPSALGTALTANPSGGVMAGSSADGTTIGMTGIAMAGTDVGDTLMRELLYRHHQQAPAVSGVAAEARPHLWTRYSRSE